jgi:hypothetical protein
VGVTRALAVLRVQLIHVWARRVDQHLGADRPAVAFFFVANARRPQAIRAALGAERRDVVDRDRAVVQSRAHKVEDEARVVVDQIGIGVFESAWPARCDARFFARDVRLAEQTRWLGEEATDHPVQERAEKQREA